MNSIRNKKRRCDADTVTISKTEATTMVGPVQPSAFATAYGRAGAEQGGQNPARPSATPQRCPIDNRWLLSTFHFNKFEHLSEADVGLRKHKLAKLTQEEIERLDGLCDREVNC